MLVLDLYKIESCIHQLLFDVEEKEGQNHNLRVHKM